jgi:hypothetical protein
MKRLLRIVAAVRRAVPYGFLKNWTAGIEALIENWLAKRDHRVTIVGLIHRSGRWHGGQHPPTFSVRDFILFMQHWVDPNYPRSK